MGQGENGDDSIGETIGGGGSVGGGAGVLGALGGRQGGGWRRFGGFAGLTRCPETSLRDFAGPTRRDSRPLALLAGGRGVLRWPFLFHASRQGEQEPAWSVSLFGERRKQGG